MSLFLSQKQSSGYFQARSCLNTVTRNVMFNMPRAAIKYSVQKDGKGEPVKSLFLSCQL